jgi:syntaxin-binding protein 5
VIAYGNGLLVSWDLHETRVLTIRGGTESQRKRLTEHTLNSDRPRTFTEKVAGRAASIGEQFGSKHSSKAEVEEEEEEKQICTVCWACQSGTVVAAGYVDGDIWLWALPIPKEGGSGELSEAHLPFISGTPLRKIDLVPGKSLKMPVIFLKWCASGKGGKDNRDASGQLFVYGGSALNATQAFTVGSGFTSFSQTTLYRLVFLQRELMHQLWYLVT